MRCIESPGRFGWAAVVLLAAGCASQAPAPTRAGAPAAAPAPKAPAAPPAVAPASPARAEAAAATSAVLPPPRAARNWDEFKRQAAQRLVAAHPKDSYTGTPPPMLFGIPVIETELNADGSVRHVRVIREPADTRARDTVRIAVEAVRRAAPYGDMARLPQPWKWTEVFLFNERRQFKPRTLDL